MTIIFLTLLLLLPSIASSLGNFPIVHTSYGAVRGYEYRASNGFVGEIFKKIPYAAPPIESRRWKKPEPTNPWNFTLDGTFAGPGCAQIESMFADPVTGFSEDCLTLNVYTSKQCKESNASCPVVFFIHGGMGYFGALTYPDETLITNFVTQGIVLVAIQYRLGAFGAMALGDDAALPANLGVHDILESLRFVRKEIHAFGGDKDQICVLGISSGANIVLTLVFSPAFNKPGETPLFARAIAMSGCAVYETEEKQVLVSHGMAALLGCTGTAREIVDCLQPLGTDEIVQATYKQGGGNTDPFSVSQISGFALAGELMPLRNMKELRDNQEDHMNNLAGSPPTKLLIGSLLNEFGNVAKFNDSRVFATNGVLGVRNVEECNNKYANDLSSGKFNPWYEVVSQSIYLTNALFAQSQSRAGGEVYLYQLDYPTIAEHGVDMNIVRATEPKDENEAWIWRVHSIYFTNFAKGLPLAPDWTEFDPELMNYYSINKSFTDGISPHMKFNYHQDIVDYYQNMQKFDENLSKVKEQLFNAPVVMKQLSLFPAKSFNLLNVLFFSTALCLALLIIFNVYQLWKDERAKANERSKLII